MRRAIDITGSRFGGLVALHDIGSRRGFRLWRLICDCGTYTEATTGTLRSGTKQSCGCLNKKVTSDRMTRDLSGMRFGRLVVIDRADANRHGHVRWNCVCDCGNKKVIAGIQISKRLGTKSCGCLRSEVARKIGDRCRKDNPISKTKQYRSSLRARLRQRPETICHERISRMLAHALDASGSIKRGKTFDLLGYTPRELRVHIERQFIGGMSWTNRGEWQIDHIVPISTAKNESEVIALNQLPNLRPLWAKENNEKRNKIVSLI